MSKHNNGRVKSRAMEEGGRQTGIESGEREDRKVSLKGSHLHNFIWGSS